MTVQVMAIKIIYIYQFLYIEYIIIPNISAIVNLLFNKNIKNQIREFKINIFFSLTQIFHIDVKTGI